MKTEVFPDADAVASQAAAFIAKEAQAAVVARRRFVMAVSGGRTPWVMLRALASQDPVEGRACVPGGRARRAAGRC